MRVQYKISFGEYISEWICFEHEGFARKKAEAWWKLRSQEPAPLTAEEAVAIAESGQLPEPTKIIVKRTPGEKYDRIVNYEFQNPEANNGQFNNPVPEYIYDNNPDIPF
jgi:DNA repair protein RadD